MPARLSEEAVLAKVGLRIAELREQRGLTQSELAARMGVEPRNAQRYEAGNDLKLSTVVRIANVLGVSPKEFFTAPRRIPRGPGRPVRNTRT